MRTNTMYVSFEAFPVQNVRKEDDALLPLHLNWL